MSKMKKILLPTLLAAATALGVSHVASIAQQAPGPGGQMRAERRPPPSPETMQRLLDGRIASAKTMLRLTEAQQKLWAPVEELVRKSHADRAKRMEEFRQNQAPGGRGGPRADVPLPDRLDRMSQAMATRAQNAKAMADAVKPLYASLSDEQKQVLGPALRELTGFGPGRGHGGRHGQFGRRADAGGPPPQQQ